MSGGVVATRIVQDDAIREGGFGFGVGGPGAVALAGRFDNLVITNAP